MSPVLSVAQSSHADYLSINHRKHSTENITYYIDPNKGTDQNSGLSIKQAWKTFNHINQIILSAGDKIKILSPGAFRESLFAIAEGTAHAPVVIQFAPGNYNFYPDHFYKRLLAISNTNDTPDEPKAIAIYLANCRFLNVNATGANIILHGKAIETCVYQSENVALHGISYNYNRPTVSEIKVVDVQRGFADVMVHPDSWYTVKDSLLTWRGEGWSYRPDSYWQVYDADYVYRKDIPFNNIRCVVLGKNKLRFYFKNNPGFTTGLIYQNRNVLRDCAGILFAYSKNITIDHVRIYFMHGMGVVSQYCKNIKVSHLSVKPDEKSGRTCAAWADILHFSGCSGLIEIKNSYLSAANDDAINIHGTFLKIVENTDPNRITVRFMQGQTYGFNAFMKGDSISFIDPLTLQAFATNSITSVKMLDGKNIALTLKHSVPQHGLNNVVENITRTPNVWIHNDTITRIPTRGILITTRRKSIIKNNLINHTYMSGVLVSDDAASWYESGEVTDLKIDNNTFLDCGEPVINIHPENTQRGTGAVHKNIRILNNTFYLKNRMALSVKSTNNINFTANKIFINKNYGIDSCISFYDCSGISTGKNKVILADTLNRSK
ncbi:right-handed parallel beta-helix repeat-containing protein [Mucilaginibacter sp. L196]|uniref:right-handed parallel beta-helix repeat-containing protein n=1 Tax=Mucilaginibacter sp. L196 TaxID=1641870 RepID=UPI00131C5B37|nr:right-handed parallel beta-helix repeat-containing protein [Mucilaginibacter sp. L196]